MNNSDSTQNLSSIDSEHAAILTNESPWEEVNEMDKHQPAAEAANKDSAARFEQEEQEKEKKRIKFPDVLEYDSGKIKILNTESNLRTLLNRNGFDAVTDEMTGENTLMNYETKHIEQDSSFGFHSRFISWAELAGAPQTLGDNHFAQLASRKRVHPVDVWLGNDKWDGVERLQPLIDALRVPAENAEYRTKVMRAWFAALMAAVYEPEFSVKMVPVLQGGQTFYKSAFVRRLFSGIRGAYSSGSFEPSNKDDLMRVIGNWCYELSELDATTSRAHVGKLKSELYKSEDKYRPPYGRGVVTKKRRIAFIGTVNGTDFLKDSTGNDRFAVIELSAPVDMEAVNASLGFTYLGGEAFRLTDEYAYKQFWLECREYYRNGAQWSLDFQAIAQQRAINEQFTDKGPYYEILHDSLFSDMDGLTIGSDNDGNWMTATDICKLCGVNISKVRPFGKALAMCVDEKMTETVTRQGKKRFYWVPNKAINVLRAQF